jgi:hypothetical protein
MMMERRRFLVTLVGGLAGGMSLALPAFADAAADVVAQLTRQGFTGIEVTTTWLGRVRIRASRDGGVREIVLNPNSGEILRDIWMAADGTGQAPTIVDDVDSGSDDDGSGDDGSGGDGSGGDDSGEDSGSNSGSGSSGSGSSGGSGSDDSGSDDSSDE